MINPLYFLYLRDLGYDKVEAVLVFPDTARAEAVRSRLGLGRVRRRRVHVGMKEIPDLLLALYPMHPSEPPWPHKLPKPIHDIYKAAVVLRDTIPQDGFATNRAERRAALDELAARYQTAIQQLG